MKRSIAIVLSSLLLLSGCSGRNAASFQTEDGIDLDLTHLSGTMVYAEVFNMRYEPDDYYGKVVRIEGYFSAYPNPETGEYYYNCVIPDATACCAQGIRFELSEALSYPEDFPENGVTVTVTGTYSIDNGGYMGYLAGSSMTLTEE